MPDYSKMYAVLCAAASEAIDLIKEGKGTQAKELLQAALYRAEDMFIDAEDAAGST